MRRGGAATVVALLALVTRAGAEPGVTTDEILIGSCAALEGPAKALGTQTLLGATAYLDQVNLKGGVHGRRIRLVSYDDGYDPARAVECFNRLKADNVFAAAFFVGTPTAARYVPLAESAKIPIVGFFAGAQLLHEPFNRYVINVRASYLDEWQQQIDNLWNLLGLRKIGIIHQDDPTSTGEQRALSSIKAALKKYGAAPVAQGSYRANTTDVQRAIDVVRAAKAEAVLMVGPYMPLAEVLKRARAADWKPLFSTVSFVGTEALIEAAGPAAEGALITQVVPPYNRVDLPGIVGYLDALRKQAPGTKPSFVSLEGYVDAMVLVAGLQRAGAYPTREKLIDGIESIVGVDVGLGPALKLTYGPRDHKGFDKVSFTVVRGGRAVTIRDWSEVAKSAVRPPP
jgi:ABC-type branched-subunit amino acid transport system substrate-binding protein